MHVLQGIEALESRCSFCFVPITLKALKTPPRKEPDFPLLHIGDHIRRCRIIRNLTQMQVAALVGVKSYPSISNWEHGVTDSLIEELPASFDLLGYDPYPIDTSTFVGRLQAKRRAMGWTILKAAREYGTNERTWSNWEREVHIPFPKTMRRLEVFLEIQNKLW